MNSRSNRSRSPESAEIIWPMFGAAGVFFIGIAYCVFMSMTHSFAARCENAGYAPNTAIYERCVARASDGGPIFEENIGRIP